MLALNNHIFSDKLVKLRMTNLTSCAKPLRFFPAYILLYFLTGLAEIILGFAFSLGTADALALIKALSVSYFISLGLLIFYTRFQNFGAALISVMGLLIVMGLLKFPALFLAMIGLFTFWILFNRQTFKWVAVCFSESLKVKDVVWLSIFALLFAMIAITGSKGIDFCVNKLIFTDGLALDSLGHASIGAMIRDYGIASHGIQGTTPLHYHTFSHFIFACISSITNLSLLQVYGNVHSIVIIPLLFLAILTCAEDYISSANRKELFIRIGFIWIALVGFNGYLDIGSIIFRKNVPEFWDSYLASQSYTISLIFLLSMISCFRIQSFRIRWPLLFLLLFCTALTKSSVGVLAGIFLFVHLVIFEHERFLYRLLFFFFTAFFILIVLFPAYSAQKSAYPGGGQIISQGLQSFSFARRDGIAVYATYGELQFWIQLLEFFATHFVYTWLFLGLGVVTCWFYKNKSHIGELCITLNILALLYGLIAIWKLKLDGGSEYYFSNISMFVALPFLVLILGQNLSIAFKEGFFKVKWWVSVLVIAIGVYGGINNVYPYLIQAGLYKLKYEAERKFTDTGLSNYISKLIEIQSDTSTKHYLVYIAKAETEFWNTLKTCHEAPFLITSISERPTIYGLPDPAYCPIDIHKNPLGLHTYSKNLFDISSMNRVPHNILEVEARKLGFKGYIDVTSKGWTKYSFDD